MPNLFPRLIWRLFSETSSLFQTIPQILPSTEVNHCWDANLLFTVCVQVNSSVLSFVPVAFENLNQNLFLELWFVFAFVVEQHL